MNKKRKAKLIFLSIMSIFNSNLQAKDTEVKKVVEKQVSSNEKVNIKKPRRIMNLRPRDFYNNGVDQTKKEISDPNEKDLNQNLTILKNLFVIALACGSLYLAINAIPWGWKKAMKFLENHNFFRNENYNETTQVINRLKDGNYHKFGTEFKEKSKGDIPENKITYVNLGQCVAKNGVYEVTLSNSKHNCIFIESKYVNSSGIKIKIKCENLDQSVVIVSPVHVEVMIDNTAMQPIGLLRISAPSISLGTENDVDDIKNVWWQKNEKVKEVYLDPEKNSIYYKIKNNEPGICRTDFLDWINKPENKNSNTVIDKYKFGPIHITNN